MKTSTIFEQAIRDGERFLAKNNFLLAKKAFATALSMQTTPELLAKVDLCVGEIARQERKLAIKQGRKLEQKGRWAEALLSFTKAQGEEEWINTRIAELQEKIAMAAITSKIAIAEQGSDLEARIAAYTQALALPTAAEHISQEIRSKKAYCLLKLHRYNETIDLYVAHPPNSESCHYYAGLAYAKLGQYCAALAQWTEVMHKDSQFEQQRLALIPFVYRELYNIAAAQVHLSAYNNIQRILEIAAKSSAAKSAWQQYVEPLRYLAQTFLWQEERLSELFNLLPPLAKTPSVPLLGLHARVTFKLAHQDSRFLENAIPLWLTAIHSQPLLDNLHARQQTSKMGTEMDPEMDPEMGMIALRDRLWQQLEQLVARQDNLPPAIGAFWQVEQRIIRLLAALPRLEEQPSIFPCTPGFAIMSQQSAQILAFLQQHQDSLDDGGEEFHELCAYFSPWGLSLLKMDQGYTAASTLATITASDHGALAKYCRQRIHWYFGIKSLLSAKKPAKKHLLSALPLIKTYNLYTDELIRLAFANLRVEACVELAEVMELLHPQVQDERFREATAHVMGIKAAHLLNKIQNHAAATKLLHKAMAIYPNSVMAKTVMEQAQSHFILDQLENALRKNNLDKAVHILQNSSDPEAMEYFFATMQQWSDDVSTWKTDEQQRTLQELYEHCCCLEQDHPVTKAIGQKIQPWKP